MSRRSSLRGIPVGTRSVAWGATLGSVLCLIAMVWAGQAAAAEQGPVAAYSFDVSEGGTAADITGNGHTATVEGATWTEDGRYGGGMQFNASKASSRSPTPTNST